MPPLPPDWLWIVAGAVISLLLAGNLWFIRGIVVRAGETRDQVIVAVTSIAELKKDVHDLKRLADLKSDVMLLKYRVFGDTHERAGNGNGHDHFPIPGDDDAGS